MFTEMFKGKLAYDHLLKVWMVWDGHHWRTDDNEEVRRLAANISHIRQRDANLISDPVKRANEFRWGIQSESINRIDAIVRYARTQDGISNSGKTWDADPLLLGCLNGVIDLKKGKLIKAQPQMGITKQVHIKFDPNAECPLWLKALEAYWPKNPKMLDYMHRAIGYSLTAFIIEQCLFLLIGRGKNGKSTLLSILEELLGDYADVVPFSALEFQNRGQISNDVAAMRGYRMLIGSETQEDVRLNEGRIKSLTGDRKARARKLYEENQSFMQTAKIWLAANHRPQIRDDTDGMWRRLHMLSMDQQFDNDKRVKGLEDRLIEKEMPGILAWAVRGCQEWLVRGLERTDEIKGEVDRYRAEANPIHDFYEECIDLAPGVLTTKAEMYAAYLSHAKLVGERYPLTRQQFSRRFTSMGFTEKVARIGGELHKCWSEVVTKSRNGATFNVSVP